MKIIYKGHVLVFKTSTAAGQRGSQMTQDLKVRKMDIKKLEYFDALYRLRSFTKASQELFITQPSLSNAIQGLETELGCALIIRNTRPLSFTPEGERLMRHTQRILGSIRDAEEDMKSARQEKQRTIRLSWPSCFLNDHLLMSLYTDFRTLYPEYKLFCIESVIEDTLYYLHEKKLDLAYVHIPDKFDTHILDFVPVICCKMYALVSEKHPLADCSKVSVVSLQGDTIFCFPERSLFRTKMEGVFAQNGIQKDMISVNKMGIIRRLVYENRGISFVTMDDGEDCSGFEGLRLLELEEQISFVKGFIFRKDQADDNAVRNLISFIQSRV